MSYCNYKKGDYFHSRFNKNDFNTYDQVGRQYAASFFNHFGWHVENFDLNQDGKVDYNRPDLRCFRDGSSEILIEVGVKEDKLWKFTSEEIDVEARKLKYVKNFNDVFLFLVKGNGEEHYLLPMWLLDLAQESCGPEYCGHSGKFKSVKTSAGFQMPEHKCYRVRKWCQRSSGSIEDDFYRIPKKYVFHYVKQGEQYLLKSSPDFGSLQKHEEERCLRCQMKLLGC